MTEAFDKFLTGASEQAVLMLRFNGRRVGEGDESAARVVRAGNKLVFDQKGFPEIS